MNKARQDFRNAMDELQPLLTTDEASGLFARVEAGRGQLYLAATTRWSPCTGRGTQRVRSEMFKDTGSAGGERRALTNAMNDMTAQFEAPAAGRAAPAEATTTAVQALMLILALAGLVIGSAIAFVIARSIVHAIHRMSAMIESVSSNNLVVEDMEVESDDEMGRAAQGLNKMKNSLRCVMLSIASTAENVSGSSREISATASAGRRAARRTRSSR